MSIQDPLENYGLERIRMEEDDRYVWVYYAGKVENVVNKLTKENEELNAKLKAIVTTDNSAVIERLEAENAELKANQTWIKPSDKLPNENQEIEFIFRRKLFDDDDGVRMRVLGVYKQMFLNPKHCIFYASAPGWGSEFLPKEVEYWMPKMPLPSEPKGDK